MIRASTTTAGAGALPWWLAPGGQTCRFCSRSYAWEAQRRCGRCDAPFCAFCVDGAVAGTPLCPGCGPDGGR